MLPMQSIEAATPTSAADENGETRHQKPKTLPCKYCSKRFRRVEHVQRHERTHTKEKPFSCGWARCGKTFGRRDLLVRHEKLVHLNEGSKEGGRPRKQSSGNAAQPGPSSSSDDHVDTEMLGLLQQQQQQQPQQQHSPTQQRAPPPQFTPDSMTSSSIAVSSVPPDHRLPPRAGQACNLDLLSDAATRLASSGEAGQMQPMMTDLAQQQQQQQQQHQQQQQPQPRVKYDDSMAYSERGRDHHQQPQDPNMLSAGYPGQQPPAASFDDYHLFLDDIATSSHFLPPHLEAEQPFGLWGRPQPGEMQGRGGGLRPPASFPSTRFPSLQPDGAADATSSSRVHDEGMRPGAPVWRISAVDHTVIKNRLDEFSSVLPSDFVFPSRHTLTRFLEGYIGGFHEHLPLLHIPTLAPAELSPELVLAILAVGAQYRFESHRGNALWYAAKAVAMEQIRRRHSHEVHGLLPTPAAYSPHSTRPSPSSGYRHSFTSVQQERPMTQETHREPYSPNTPQSRLETIQALLLLFAVGLWGAKAILNDALSLQSQLALLVREEGLAPEPIQTAVVDWDTWIRIESGTRTKLIAYCFFNLCSVAYNTPPLLLTSEVALCLPAPSRLWRAESAWQWQEMRQDIIQPSFQDAFSRLLNRPSQGPLSHVSTLGHYVLVHALVQHVFLLKQTSFAAMQMVATSPFVEQQGLHRGLKMEDTEEVAQALRVWQIGFEQHLQMRAAETASSAAAISAQQQQQQQLALQMGGGGGGPGGPGGMAGGPGPGAGPETFTGGPVAFNSTALLRLAYIRLYTDLSPGRALETRDHVQVANAFSDAPLPSRNPRLHRAILQAIHSLAVLVKVGVNYVARTKSLEWSMQHSLCNLECAVLLSKWLMTLASIGPNEPPATPEERTILDSVRTMVNETEFAVPIDPSLNERGGGASSGGGGGGGSHHHQQHHQSHHHPHHHHHQSGSSSSRSDGGAFQSSSDSNKLRQLAAAVIRLWAETFKGNNHVFEIVRVMALGLDGYADLLEKLPRDRTPMGRMAPGSGLG